MNIYTYNKSIAEAINELDKKLKRAKNRMNSTEWDRVSVGLDAVLHSEIKSILDNLNEIYNSYEGASTSRDTVEKATYDTMGKDICLVPDPTPSISDVSEDEESVMEEDTLSYQVKGDSIGCSLSDIIMIDTDVYDSLCIVDDTEKAILFNRGQFIENINDASVESIKFIGLAGDITVYSIPTMYGLFSKSLAEKDKEKECKCDDMTADEDIVIKADTETLMDLDESESSTGSANNTDPISNFKRIAKIILLDEIPILEMISDMSNLMHAIKYVIMSSSDMTLDILKAHIAYRADMYKQGISDKVLVELAEFINRLYSDVDI